jgi:hypothetical protein
VKRNRFFQTSVARIAALFTAAFVLGSVLLLAAVYLAASRIIDRDIETLIVEEGNELSQQFVRLDRAAFTGLVRQRVHRSRSAHARRQLERMAARRAPRGLDRIRDAPGTLARP